ncbi:hypothetical protein B0H15DRAFT_958179 [Mycena belliarum]|uniref:Uncharacterized protein n=1 Tax=Mycena belliarum TaxID=1033014 RepID=A0AAD6TQN5_9AGAR|nr:hypothetical protein B0H15DRAFT_958179 [Mycena belliae]
MAGEYASRPYPGPDPRRAPPRRAARVTEGEGWREAAAGREAEGSRPPISHSQPAACPAAWVGAIRAHPHCDLSGRGRAARVTEGEGWREAAAGREAEGSRPPISHSQPAACPAAWVGAIRAHPHCDLSGRGRAARVTEGEGWREAAAGREAEGSRPPISHSQPAACPAAWVGAIRAHPHCDLSGRGRAARATEGEGWREAAAGREAEGSRPPISHSEPTARPATRAGAICALSDLRGRGRPSAAIAGARVAGTRGAPQHLHSPPNQSAAARPAAPAGAICARSDLRGRGRPSAAIAGAGVARTRGAPQHLHSPPNPRRAPPRGRAAFARFPICAGEGATARKLWAPAAQVWGRGFVGRRRAPQDPYATPGGEAGGRQAALLGRDPGRSQVRWRIAVRAGGRAGDIINIHM